MAAAPAPHIPPPPTIPPTVPFTPPVPASAAPEPAEPDLPQAASEPAADTGDDTPRSGLARALTPVHPARPVLGTTATLDKDGGADETTAHTSGKTDKTDKKDPAASTAAVEGPVAALLRAMAARLGRTGTATSVKQQHTITENRVSGNSTNTTNANKHDRTAKDERSAQDRSQRDTKVHDLDNKTRQHQGQDRRDVKRADATDSKASDARSARADTGSKTARDDRSNNDNRNATDAKTSGTTTAKNDTATRRDNADRSNNDNRNATNARSAKNDAASRRSDDGVAKGDPKAPKTDRETAAGRGGGPSKPDTPDATGDGDGPQAGKTPDTADAGSARGLLGGPDGDRTSKTGRVKDLASKARRWKKTGQERANARADTSDATAKQQAGPGDGGKGLDDKGLGTKWDKAAPKPTDTKSPAPKPPPTPKPSAADKFAGAKASSLLKPDRSTAAGGAGPEKAPGKPEASGTKQRTAGGKTQPPQHSSTAPPGEAAKGPRSLAAAVEPARVPAQPTAAGTSDGGEPRRNAVGMQGPTMAPVNGSTADLAKKNEPVDAPARTGQAEPAQVLEVSAGFVEFETDSGRRVMSRGEIRTLKAFERRMDTQAGRLAKVAERSKTVKAEAEAIASEAKALAEKARGVKGGERLLRTLNRLAETAQTTSTEAVAVERAAVRGTESVKTLVTNADTRHGIIYRAVVDSPLTTPAEREYYQDKEGS
ncbi:hypothetical protein AB0C76_33030 [Kitasatospora sp. NPDC048722]|uniref:hypothetical protein n=1 Tax=Kitasatospora sp. NPDC048722 TaxID=3155639 RepID=UPI0033F5B4FA